MLFRIGHADMLENILAPDFIAFLAHGFSLSLSTPLRAAVV
jgi:hypothetical protein